MAFQAYSSSHKVQAEQIEESRSVITPQGPITAYPGQWEVRYPDGNVRILDNDAFEEEWGGEESADPTAGQSQESQIGDTVAPATVGSDSGTDVPVTTVGAPSDSASSPVSDSGSAPAEETTTPAESTAPTGTASPTEPTAEGTPAENTTASDPG